MKKNIKILHIGNIANNAYKNSVILRKMGVQCDVLCYDYFHVMGCPEWEETEFKNNYGDDYNPNFSKVNLKGYSRPAWFKQGFLEEIYKDINITCETKQDIIFSYERLILKSLFAPIKYLFGKIIKLENFLIKRYFSVISKFFHRYPLFFRIISSIRNNIKFYANLYLFWAKKQLSQARYNYYDYIDANDLPHLNNLIKDFKNFFPSRVDHLTIKDIMPYLNRARLFREIFKDYSLIHCYATDPIWPMLTNFKPYIAYEHGTIRNIPFDNTAIGRLTALAYRKANLVIITNCDAIDSAKKLGIKNFIGAPHPINTKWIDNTVKEENKVFLLFCPLRHDYSVKGTDKYIRALKIIKTQVKIPVKMVMIEWGLEIKKSKSLINKLNLDKDVLWQKSMPSKTLTNWILKSDVVCDQIALPHFGATAPLAMAASKPVLMSYRPESTRWLFPEDAPIIPVFNENDIVKAILNLINNPKQRLIIGKRGVVWFNKYHSNEIVGKILIESYNKLLRIKNEPKKKVRKT